MEIVLFVVQEQLSDQKLEFSNSPMNSYRRGRASNTQKKESLANPFLCSLGLSLFSFNKR